MTSHVEPSATSIMVTGPVGECLQAGTQDSSVLDLAAPLRRLHDSGAGYKYDAFITPSRLTAAPDRGKLVTFIAGRLRRLLFAKDRQRSVYEKKPESYAKDNRTEFNRTQ